MKSRGGGSAGWLCSPSTIPPSFLSSSISSPFSFSSFFLTCLKGNLTSGIHIYSCSSVPFLSIIFSPSPPISHRLVDFTASRIFNLALSPVRWPSPPLPPTHTVSPLQCRTKWRLMKGGWCVCHPDRPVQSPQPAKHHIYSERTSEGWALRRKELRINPPL